jgi:hypothetical protein
MNVSYIFGDISQIPSLVIIVDSVAFPSSPAISAAIISGLTFLKNFS